MKIIKILTIVFLSQLLSGCWYMLTPDAPKAVEEVKVAVKQVPEYTPSRYPPAVRKNFIESCAPNFNEQFCSCAVDKLAQKVTLRQFIEEEQILVRTGDVTSKFRQAMEMSYIACESQ